MAKSPCETQDELNRNDIGPALAPGAIAYVCGSAGFADTVTELLTKLGASPASIRVERFGPTG
jgi:ferredoxin-NADP reductase